MNVKMTLVLMALVGVGASVWWFGGPQLPPAIDPTAHPAQSEDKGTREFLEGLRPNRIERIEVRAPSGTTQLTRKPHDGWSLPGNWNLREFEVNALVDLLANLRSRFLPYPLGDPNKELAKFGLDLPSVTVLLKVDGQEHTLAFGEQPSDSNENRFSRDTYLLLDKKPEVLRLAPGLIAALDKPTDYYQERRLFLQEIVTQEGGREEVEQLKAQSVRVEDNKVKGAPFTLIREKKYWKDAELSEPVRDRLDETAAKSLLAAVSDLWAEKFVPRECSDAPGIAGAIVSLPMGSVASAAADLFFATQDGLLVRSGLTKPERMVAVKQSEHDQKPIVLEIGAVSTRRTRMMPAPRQQGMPAGMGQGMMPVTEEYRYAKLNGNDQIFEIKADKLKDVFVALDSLRDNRLAHFNSGDVRKVEIKHGGEDILLEKDKDKWKLKEPVSAVADSGKVTDLLSKLTDLQARDKDVLDKEDPKKYGFDEPVAVVKVTVEEEAKSGEAKEKKTRELTIRVGKHDADKKKLYVMVDDLPRINIVDDSLAPLVECSALAYRGKQMFDFNAADVARLDIDHQGKKITLERGKEGWRLVNPVKAEADTALIDQLLGDLGRLEAAEFLAQAPKKEELGTRYGLDKPAFTVRIEFTDQKKPAQVLHVGKAQSGKEGYFARLADGGPVFAISEHLHKQLARDSLVYRPQILWQLLPEEIVSLHLSKAGQKEYALTRSENDWKISGPFEANASGEAAQKMTAELVAPKAEGYTAHEAKDLKEYGLDKPALTVRIKTVLDKDDKIHTLLIGKATKGGGGSLCQASERRSDFHDRRCSLPRCRSCRPRFPRHQTAASRSGASSARAIESR